MLMLSSRESKNDERRKLKLGINVLNSVRKDECIRIVKAAGSLSHMTSGCIPPEKPRQRTFCISSSFDNTAHKDFQRPNVLQWKVALQFGSDQYSRAQSIACGSPFP